MVFRMLCSSHDDWHRFQNLFFYFRSHYKKVKHIDEPLEGFNKSRACLFTEFVFIKHYNKFYFSNFLKQGLQEIGNSDNTHIVAGIFIPGHIDQAQLMFIILVDIRSQGHRGKTVSNYGHIIIRGHLRDKVRIEITFSDHWFFENPIENGALPNSREAHEYYGVLVSLHDLPVPLFCDSKDVLRLFLNSLWIRGHASIIYIGDKSVRVIYNLGLSLLKILSHYHYK